MSDFEDQKYHMAREIWAREAREDTYTPSGIRWRDWFKKKFGEDYMAYTRRMMEQKRAG